MLNGFLIRIILLLFSLSFIPCLLDPQSKAYGQIILEVGDYKTVGSGFFSNLNIWQVWNGTQWVAASSKPNRNNSIFIDQGHEVSILGIEEAHHIYLFSSANPGKKINLQQFELHVYGALRCVTKSSGSFFIHPVTNATVDWIYPEQGKIVFKGNSRTIVNRDSWSANNINSRFTVVFDPGPGEILTVDAGFKANSFLIQSGSVFQTVNFNGIPACSTFSYNNQTSFNGTGAYGDFVIEAGATLISECSAPLESLIRRSNTTLAALFHLKKEGNLILLGNEPMMEMQQFVLEGNVYYQGQSGIQHMLNTSFPGTAIPNTYNNLFFNGNAQKVLRPEIFLLGNFTFIGGGNIVESPTVLHFVGVEDQNVFNYEMDLSDINVNKPSGRLNFTKDLRIKNTFQMFQGLVNFNENELWVNTSGNGGYVYFGGEWLNLKRFNYQSIPAQLSVINATFPFLDKYQGGVRYVQIDGATPGGNLKIEFYEIPGANWDPNFDDYDGTPILYQLRSYFKMFTSQTSHLPLTLRISAQQLIVDQLQDLRIVSNGLYAPGIHLTAQDPNFLWARRSLNFQDLHENTFTIGSYAQLSILPIRWISHKAIKDGNRAWIEWSVVDGNSTKEFIVHQSFRGIGEFQPIFKVSPQQPINDTQNYKIELTNFGTTLPIYFQLEHVDEFGTSNFSEVFGLEGKDYVSDNIYQFWPNPYEKGRFDISGIDYANAIEIDIVMLHHSGKVIYKGNYWDFIQLNLENLTSGLYIIMLENKDKIQSIKMIKR
jgi:hypothetical protein